MRYGHFFYLADSDMSIGNGTQIFRCRKDYLKTPDFDDVYVALMNDGVHFYLHRCSDKEGNHFSGCILFLPLTLDSDSFSEMSLILNSLPNYKTKDLDDLFEDSFGGYNIDLLERDTPYVRLLMSFLFEMKHSNLFRQSTLYSKIDERFRSHPLLDAIWTKAEYIYCRGQLEKFLCEHKQDAQSENFATDKFEKSLLDDSLLVNMVARAERRWVDCIVRAASARLFHESTWLDEDVDEMNAVFNNTLCMNPKIYTRQPDIVSETASMAMEWYMSYYRPDGVFRIRFGNQFRNPMVVSSTGVVFLAVLGVLYCWFYNPWFSSFVRTLFLVLMIVPIALSMAVYFVYWYKTKGRRHFFKFKTLSNIMMPRLFAAIVAGWMTVGLSDIVLEDHPAYEHYVGYSFLLVVPIGFFLYFSVKKIIPFANWKTHICIVAVLICLSIVYAVLSGSALFWIYNDESYLFGCHVSANHPQILLVFSMLAVFVGIFIQMLFRGKSISASEE